MSIDEEIEKAAFDFCPELTKQERQRLWQDDDLFAEQIRRDDARENFTAGYRAALGKLEWRKPEEEHGLPDEVQVFTKGRKWRWGSAGPIEYRLVHTLSGGFIDYDEGDSYSWEVLEWARIRLPEE